jgi:ATP-dependent phosphoenolpyruvate carboxykinase
MLNVVMRSRSLCFRYFVKEPESEQHIAWGDGNQSMSEENFEWLLRKAQAYMQNRAVYVMDVRAGHDPKNQVGEVPLVCSSLLVSLPRPPWSLTLSSSSAAY